MKFPGCASHYLHGRVALQWLLMLAAIRLTHSESVPSQQLLELCSKIMCLCSSVGTHCFSILVEHSVLGGLLKAQDEGAPACMDREGNRQASFTSKVLKCAVRLHTDQSRALPQQQYRHSSAAIQAADPL